MTRTRLPCLPRLPRVACALAVAAALAGTSLAAATPARAEAVWDPEEIARLSETAAMTAEQLSHVVELLSTINDLGRTVGRFGQLSQLDFMRLDATAALSGAAPDLGFLAATVPDVASMRFSTLADADTAVRRILALPGDRPATASELTALRSRLDALGRSAAETGYAVALSTQDLLSVGATRTDMLATQAEAQMDARGDVGANTSVGLSVFEQLTQIQALLASIAEVEALDRLTERDLMPGTATAAPH